MLAWRQKHWVAVYLAAFVALLAAGEVRAQATGELSALRDQVSRLQDQGKYAEATPIAESYIALARQKYGEEHIEFATTISEKAPPGSPRHNEVRKSCADPGCGSQ